MDTTTDGQPIFQSTLFLSGISLPTSVRIPLNIGVAPRQSIVGLNPGDIPLLRTLNQHVLSNSITPNV